MPPQFPTALLTRQLHRLPLPSSPRALRLPPPPPRRRRLIPCRPLLRAMASTAAGEAPAPSPAASAGTSGGGGEARPRRTLEELAWDHSFVRELPGDPRSDAMPREVLHACYTKVSPSAKVEDPKLVAWSESVADLLDLDHKENQE